MMSPINLLHPDVRANPYPVYAELRRGPVRRVEPGDRGVGQRTHDDRAVEQPFRGRKCRQHRGFSAAARLPEDRDVPRIAAEPRDVVAHPFEGRYQIEQRQVRGAREALARAGQPGKPQVSERIQPVIDADGDDVVLPRELGAIVEDRVSRSRALAAAMEPHHHRPLSGPD